MKLFGKKNPISYSSAVIVCDGNSLTYGYLSSNAATKSYPALIDADATFSTATVYNLGVSAQTTQDMISDAVSEVDSKYNGAVSNVLVAWEVGNDIYFNGNATTAVSTFWSYVDARKAVGFKVIVINCTPRDQTTSFGDNPTQYNAKLTTANGLLQSQWSAHADAFVDLAGDSRFSGYNLTYYNADKVHYTDAGYQVVKDLVKSALLSL